MPVFNLGETIKTDQPVIEVTVSPDAPLPVGRYRFQLIVVSAEGVPSQPAFLTIEIPSPAPKTLINTARG